MPTHSHVVRPRAGRSLAALTRVGMLVALVGCQGTASEADIATDGIDTSSTNALTATTSITGPIKPQKDGGKCLDIRDGSQNNGAAVQLATCYGNAAQNWNYAGGQLKIFGNKCLDVPEGKLQNGTRLQIWDCDSNNANQQWARNGQTFVWRNTYCLDIPDGNTVDLTPVQIWECGSGNVNQAWNTTGTAQTTEPLTSTTSITGPIKPQKDGGKCLDVREGSQNNGAAIQLATCYGNAAQNWSYTGGQLKVFGNKCLDVPDGKRQNGVQLQIWDCNSSSSNQQWTRNGQTFVWQNTYCLDLSGGNTMDLTPIQIWECGSGNVNQAWNTTGTPTVTTPSPTPSTPQTGSGAAATSYSSNTPGASGSQLSQPGNSLNVLDYGVRGDGSSDNTQALQNAFNAAGAQGKIAWIPAGTYNHSGVVKANGVKVVGAGQSTILRATNQYNSAITITGQNGGLSNVATQVAAANRSSQPYDCAVLIIGAQNATVSYVSVQGASANGIRIDSSSGCTVTKSFVNGSNADGVAIVNGATSNTVSYVQVSNASDDSFSSNSYPGEKQSSGNVFTNCYAGPNYKQGRSFCMMGSARETIRNSVSVGSLWHGIVAGTDPGSTTQWGYGFTIGHNLVTGNASGLPVMITTDGGMNYSGDGSLANVSGTMTSGDPASVLGWAPITNVPSPATFNNYTGGGPGSNNTAGNRQ